MGGDRKKVFSSLFSVCSGEHSDTYPVYKGV